MSCAIKEKNGPQLVDFIREKEKQDVKIAVHHEINCSCGKSFEMMTAVDQCPHCHMTYGVTPCSADERENIKAAGINY